MKKDILFVNSCIRKNEVSRTYKIAESFINKYMKINPHDKIAEVKLSSINLKCICGDIFEERENLISNKNLENNMFDLAKQFANADKIIVAAPLWELSFPAVLKVYIENIAIRGITFDYGENGNYGLCKAEKLVYITTRGGYFNCTGGFNEMGSIYMHEMCKMFGINNYSCICAEGIDADLDCASIIIENTVSQALEAASNF